MNLNSADTEKRRQKIAIEVSTLAGYRRFERNLGFAMLNWFGAGFVSGAIIISIIIGVLLVATGR